MGKAAIIDQPDMNKDGKVETNDFTMEALLKNVGISNPLYDERFDINGSGIIDTPDLDYIKNWLFEESKKELNQLSIECFLEKGLYC